MIREYTLPRAQQQAVIEVLAPLDLRQVLALQEATRNALPEDQKQFILPQKPEYFEKFLTRKNGFMIGIRVGDQLVAQMVAMGALTLEEAIERKAFNRNQIPYHHAEPTDLIMVAKSMAVHPEWRGNDLAQNMLEAMLDMPSVRAADHVFAQMSAANTRSWDLFLKSGFGIVAAAIDPGDHLPRFILQKPALGFEIYPQPSVTGIDPNTDFNAIMRLTTYEALIGCNDASATTKLSFFACGDTAAAWTDEPAKLA